MTISALRRKVEALKIEDVAVDAVTETKETIADLNVMQMINGLRSDGSDITPSYTPFTVEIKKMKGQIFDHVTLRDTGAFQTAMFAKVEGLKVVTGSNDPKSAKIEKKYSKAKGSIFGLSEKYKAEFIKENLRPAFQRKITDLIGLKF